MMSLSPGALNAGQAETYFEQHYSHDDYYSEGRKVAGRWFGRGASKPLSLWQSVVHRGGPIRSSLRRPIRKVLRITRVVDHQDAVAAPPRDAASESDAVGEGGRAARV